MPKDTRSVGAPCLSPSELIGSTEMPRWSMRNENSLVPCAEPRYLTMRRRRVAVSSLTRWLKTTTKSATYSSRPWRVMAFSPLSPVTIAVTPRSASHWKRRLISARMMISSLERREEDLDGVEDDALGADRVDLGAEAHEQALEVVLARLLHLVALDADVVEGEQALLLESLEVEALGGEVRLEVARASPRS